MRHAPRSAPVVSRAKRIGSCPESLIVKNTPGCRRLMAAAEFSTSCGRASVGSVVTEAGDAPMESVPT
jgi:hypothetical protein